MELISNALTAKIDKLNISVYMNRYSDLSELYKLISSSAAPA